LNMAAMLTLFCLFLLMTLGQAQNNSDSASAAGPGLTDNVEEELDGKAWYVACGKDGAKGPEREWLKNDDGSPQEITGKWSSIPCKRGWPTVGTVSIPAETYKHLSGACKDKGFQTAQPTSGTNDTFSEGWHPFLVDDNVQENIWYHWNRYVFMHSQTMPTSNCTGEGTTVGADRGTPKVVTDDPETDDVILYDGGVSTNVTTGAPKAPQQWFVACAKRNDKVNQSHPVRTWLKDDSGSPVTTTGTYETTKCSKRGWDVGMVTIPGKEYEKLVRKCIELGYKTAQPTGNTNDNDDNGWHPYKTDTGVVGSHYWYHWYEGRFHRSPTRAVDQC